MLGLSVHALSLLLTLTTALPTPNPNAEASPTAEPNFSDLEARQSIDITRNDLSGPCKPVTVIFGRGTAELGNVGSLTGPPFFNSLGSIIGYDNIAVQGVDYPADFADFLAGGSSDGSKTLASLVNQAADKCPKTQIVVSGYSQGAQLVHNGLKQVSGDVAERIKAAVLFGDPDNGQSLQGVSADKVVTYCYDDDLICKGQSIILAAHLSYALKAGDAASFVASRVQV